MSKKTSVHIGQAAFSLSQLSHEITISHLWFHEIRRQTLITELLLPMRVLSTTFIHVRFLIHLCTLFVLSLARLHASERERERERESVYIHFLTPSLSHPLFHPCTHPHIHFPSLVCTLSLKSIWTYEYFSRNIIQNLITRNDWINKWKMMNVNIHECEIESVKYEVDS